MKKNKKGVFPLMTLIFFGVLIVVGVLLFQNWQAGKPLPLAVTTPPTTTGPGAEKPLCAVEDTTVTLSGVDAFASSTAVLGNHEYRINKNPWLPKADGGTFTASPYDVIGVAFGAGNTTYFTKMVTEEIKCVGTQTISTTMYQNASGAVIRVFNEEGNLITSSEHETVGAGDVVTLSMDITGHFEKGVPHGGLCIAEYNSTAFDDAIIELGGSKTSVPDFYTTSDQYHKAKAYTIPAFLSSKKISGTITLDADDTVNPETDGVNVTLTCMGYNWFENTERQGEYELDVEDMDDSFVGIWYKAYTLTVD